MNNLITQKKPSIIAIGILVLLGITTLGGCSQKPSNEEIAAQVKIAMAEAEKAKQEAAEPPATPVATPKAAAKPAAKAKPVVKPQPIQETPAQKIICTNCGVVISVNMVELEGKGSGLGVIAGGVAGGLLGHQVGEGTGKDLATIAGAVGGAIAGNKIEKVIKKTKVYDVTVKMESGEEVVLRHPVEPGVVAGDKVKVENELVIKQ